MGFTKSSSKVIAKSLLLFVTFLLLPKYTNGEEKLSKFQESMSKWRGMCHRNYSQSPINILDNETLTFNKFDPIEINYLDEIQNNVTLINHKSGVSIKDLHDRTLVYGGPLRGQFYVDHIDFISLSEHTLNSVRFELECQIICHNERYSGGYLEAVKKINGIAILSVLFQSSGDYNTNFEDILANVDKIKHSAGTERTTFLNEFRLRQLLPHIGPYYTYMGSLTKPDCDDGVTWIIFRDRYHINPNQTRVLRSIVVDVDSPAIGNNFRPLQPTLNRTVVISERNLAKAKNRAARVHVSASVCFMSSFMVLKFFAFALFS